MSPIRKWTDLIEDANNSTSGFEPLEVGTTYDFVIEKPAEVGETQKGNAKFTINPVVESGPRKNGRIFHTFFVSDSGPAMKRHFFAPMTAMGLDIEFFKKNPTDPEVAQALQGKRFRATVVQREGQNGGVFLELGDFRTAEGSAPQAGVPGVPAGPSAPAATAAPSPAVTEAPQTPAPQTESPWNTAPPPPPAF